MRLPTADGEQSGGPVTGQLQSNRARLRFTDYALAPAGVGRCAARVELEWLDQQRVTAEASGEIGRQGEVRAMAEATLRAIEEFTAGALSFGLVGVKVMRGFDADIVMVSVMLEHGGATQRLLGCHLADQDLLRGAVMATLHATNRVVASFLAAKGA